MKRLLSIVALFAAFTMALNAQQVGPNISWDNASHQFGDIKEAGGKVTHKFTFTNTGSEPLVLTNVRPSCGCTSSDYTKAPIAPGATGYVSATFNPERRPGKFNKSITITSNATPPTSSIRFSGNVIPKPKTLADSYPRRIGELNLVTNHVALMKVSNKEIKSESIGMANTTDHDIEVSFRNIPAHITIVAEPKVLKPEQKGTITVSYDGSKKGDWGFLMDKVVVAINGETNQGKNKLSVSATLNEDFSNMSPEERAKAPVATFDNKIFDFGTIKQGETVSHTYRITNNGKNDLIIRKIKPSCGCTVVNPSKDLFKPGESGTFDVTFRSAGKKNKQNKSITVVTNDPNNPQISLRVTGTVNVN